MEINLNKISLSKNKTLFDGLSYLFSKGINVISGQSGVGKSSLLRVILGFEVLDHGEIQFNNEKVSHENIAEFRNNIAWIPQNFKQFGDVKFSQFISKLDLNNNEFSKNLNFFNLKYEDKSLSEFSTGELQRIFLAIAKTQNRDILLADEPSSALDSDNRFKLIEFFKSFTGMIICVTHDKELIEIADKQLKLGEK